MSETIGSASVNNKGIAEKALITYVVSSPHALPAQQKKGSAEGTSAKRKRIVNFTPTPFLLASRPWVEAEADIQCAALDIVHEAVEARPQVVAVYAVASAR